MKKRIILLAAGVTLLICLIACASRTPQVVNKPAEPVNIDTIALLPVACAAGDFEVSGLLKEKLLKELHFKGYPPVLAEMVDGRLNCQSAQGDVSSNNEQAVGSDRLQIAADAAMQCSILENSTSKKLFYAPVTVTLGCELRSTATGEVLWAAHHRATCRSFDLFRDRLDMKALGSLESALEEAVARVLESLHYGPQLRG